MMGGVVKRPMAVMGGSPRAGDAAPARAAAPPPAPPAPARGTRRVRSVRGEGRGVST
jgi:hypothetical protein